MSSVQLPMCLVPDDQESGFGYCLRCVSVQGFNLHWLRRACSVPDRRAPKGKDIPAISWVLQADTRWLTTSLPIRVNAEGIAWKFAGHAIQCSSHLRRCTPQVCEKCLVGRGVCRLSWEISLVTVCTRHGFSLTDYCSRCRSAIRWDRPSIAECRCGNPLTPGVPRSAPLEEESLISRFIEARLEGQEVLSMLREGGLPAFLGGLSLGSLLSMIHAFGQLKDALQVMRPSITERSMPTAHWRLIVQRAVTRLRELEAGKLEPAVVARPILTRMHQMHHTQVDSHIWEGLSTRLDGGSYAKESTRMGFQFSLFAAQIAGDAHGKS